jgi:hypothetical protein
VREKILTAVRGSTHSLRDTQPTASISCTGWQMRNTSQSAGARPTYLLIKDPSPELPACARTRMSMFPESKALGQ